MVVQSGAYASRPMSQGSPIDWLALCRRASAAVHEELARFPAQADRAVATGHGEGGDIALVIDRAAEDAIFRELEMTDAALTVISEERGRVDLNGGGDTHVVVDPIDGSRNAKRGIPSFSVSIAVAHGPTIGDVELAYVHDLGIDEEWHAAPGQGAWLGDARLPQLAQDAELELLGLETIHPRLVAGAADALVATGAARMRALGSHALSLCWVAGARFDAMLSLSACRSVDTAAGQLIVREAGGVVALPDAGDDLDATPLDLAVRTRVLAAASPALLERLRAVDAG
jgi:myo-inositol-1(or 4)-monophosphatase